MSASRGASRRYRDADERRWRVVWSWLLCFLVFLAKKDFCAELFVLACVFRCQTKPDIRGGEAVMQRVTGFGGVFFRAKDPVALRAWYQRHLGVDVQGWGGAVFPWPSDADRAEGDGTIWSIGGDDHAAFAGSAVPFVINYRVADLRVLLAVLKEEGCDVQGDAIDSEFGLFGRVTDPEGNMIELWQPPA